MVRIKTNKEYTIRLVHPEFGTFYYNYSTYDNCVFTQKLSRVAKWKTYFLVEQKIKDLEAQLSRKTWKIHLSFGTEVSDEIKNKISCNRKKYYYDVTSITSKHQFEKATDNIDNLKKTLVTDSETISETISNLIRNGFTDCFFDKISIILKKFNGDINSYKKDYNYLKKCNHRDVGAYLDIADASYGFRLLKLKTLKDIQNE